MLRYCRHRSSVLRWVVAGLALSAEVKAQDPAKAAPPGIAADVRGEARSGARVDAREGTSQDATSNVGEPRTAARASALEIPGRRGIYFIVGSRTAENRPTSEEPVRGMAFAYDRTGETCTLLTAAHVVKDASEINAYLWTDEQAFGTAFEARVAWIDERSDTAALTIRSTEDCRPVSRYIAPVPVGRRVFAFLHTPHHRGMMTAGYIGGFWRINGSPTIVCDMQIQKGHSGSPLVDEYGRLLGMVVSKANTLEVNAGFAVPVSRIKGEYEARAATPVPAVAGDEN